MTINPDNIRHIIQNQTNFTRRENKASKRLFGRGLGTDEERTLHCAVATPQLCAESFGSFNQIVRAKGLLVGSHFEEAAQRNQPLDLQKLCKKFAVDTLGLFILGVEINTLRQEHDFMKHLDIAIEEVHNFKTNPFPFLRKTESKEFLVSVQAIDDYIYTLITKAKQLPTSELEKRTDLLSRLALAKDIEGSTYPDQTLRNVLVNLFLYGRDAVMSFLSWSIYRLAKHNHIQTQFRAEAAEVLGNEDIPTDPMLKKMPVLDRILEEVLRLHPPVPYVDRVALKDDKLPDGTLIKAGDVVTLHLYCLQRFPSYWGRFASGFIPNRWEDTASWKHPLQFLPYFEGPQKCIGKKVGNTAAKMVLPMLVRRFSFKLKKKVNSEFGPTLRAQKGIYVTVDKLL